MRIALVAHGLLPIPPSGWGAVEVLIDGYREHLRRAGHTVDVYNSVFFNETIVALRERNYDFIHLHSDLQCSAFERHLGQPFCVTSHNGGIARFAEGRLAEGRLAEGIEDPAYEILFQDMLRAPGNLVFTESVRELYLRRGYDGFLRVLENPIDVQRFTFNPRGNGRAICLGRIQRRKRQALLANVAAGRVPIDFVGPHDLNDEADFKPVGPCRFLGEWTRQEVYDRLTDYSCLVLLSRSEGDPLVVKEALAAGLSVVVTESSRGRLPRREFITLLKDDEAAPQRIVDTVSAAISLNQPLRPAIREYALNTFHFGALLPIYIDIVEEFRQWSSR
jgi:glycosyltransferase involved in cell wall biosynthesis